MIDDAIAATQQGVAARQQLLTAGVPAKAIDYRVVTGRLSVVHPGVYRIASSPQTWPQRLLAAMMAAGPCAVASHRAAAHLRGLIADPRIEVTTTVDHARCVAGVLIHRTRQLPRADVEIVDAISRTRPARTLIDLAAVLTRAALEEVLEHALARRLVTCAYLGRRLIALGTRGRLGAGVLSQLIDDHAGWARPENHFERRLFRILPAAGLPLPVPQYEVALGDGRRAFVDYAYPELRIALEADSYRHSSKSDWERDHVRNRRLTAIGWRVFPVTAGDLDRPTEFLAELRYLGPDYWGAPTIGVPMPQNRAVGP